MRIFIAVLIAMGIVAAQFAYGGLMLTALAVPAYFLVSVAGLLSMVAVFWKRAVASSPLAVVSAVLAAGYFFWRSLTSSGPDFALFYSLLVLACLVTYLTVASVVTTPSARYAFVGVLLAAAVAQVVIAGMQFSSRDYFMPQPWLSEQFRVWYERGGGMQRGRGSFLNGNQLAWFLNAMTFLVIGVACFGRCRLWVKILFAYLGGVCAVGMLLTLSRGGVIAFGAGLAVFLVLGFVSLGIGARDRRFPFIAALAGVIAVALGGALYFFLQSETVQNRMERIGQDTYRLNLWPAAVRQAQIEPLTGTGAGSFAQISRRLCYSTAGLNNLFAHNDWAQTASDFGFLGLALMGLVLFMHLAAGWQGLLRGLRERMAVSSVPQSSSVAFAVGALSAAVSFGFHAFFDFNMQVPSNALLAAACLGLLANSGVPSPQRIWISRLVRPATAVAAFLGGLGLLLLLERHAALEIEVLRADNELVAGRYETAIQFAAQGLKRNPDHPRLRRILGEAQLKLASASSDRQTLLTSAAFQLRKAAALDPEERWNHFLLGLALSAQGATSESAAAHVEAIRLDPTSAVLREYYALLLEESGLSEEAIQAYLVSVQMPGIRFARDRLQQLQQRQHQDP